MPLSTITIQLIVIIGIIVDAIRHRLTLVFLIDQLHSGRPILDLFFYSISKV